MLANLYEHLGFLQMDWEANLDAIKETTSRLNLLEKQDEQFWHHRSHIWWLQASDSNTTFFH